MDRSSGWISIRWCEMPAFLQSLPLLFDIRFVVDTFQSLSEFSESRFQLGEFCVKVCCLETPLLAARVHCPGHQDSNTSGNAMLVQVDPVHSPHEHEAGTALFAELVTSGFQLGSIPRSTSLLLGRLLRSALRARLLIHIAQFSPKLQELAELFPVGSVALFACCIAAGRACPSPDAVTFSTTT